MKAWLDDLIDEYPTKRPAKTIARLARVFSDVEDETMQAAVDRYLLEQRFFPKVSDLKPYVDLAVEAGRGEKPYGAIEQQARRYTDAEILAFEQARGTMPPDELLGTEWLAEKVT